MGYHPKTIEVSEEQLSNFVSEFMAMMGRFSYPLKRRKAQGEAAKLLGYPDFNVALAMAKRSDKGTPSESSSAIDASAIELVSSVYDLMAELDTQDNSNQISTLLLRVREALRNTEFQLNNRMRVVSEPLPSHEVVADIPNQQWKDLKELIEEEIENEATYIIRQNINTALGNWHVKTSGNYYRIAATWMDWHIVCGFLAGKAFDLLMSGSLVEDEAEKKSVCIWSLLESVEYRKYPKGRYPTDDNRQQRGNNFVTV